MQINVEDYEKLGRFYLGREYDQRTKSMLDNLVMYDSKDLVTHGVVLGMTGSGKTGLCLTLLEEAAMDGIPAIVIDPKGDIANFCLTFPDLAPSDFRPWINEDDAAKKNLSPDEFAAAQAAMWKKGLADWGQSGDRIKQLRDKVGITIYTPGSNAGIPVSILSSMQVPEFEILDDAELLSDRIESTVSSILGLVGINADPIKSPEHILLSNIINHCWHENESLDLANIIEYVQKPPFPTIGVIAADEFYAPKKRSELAMQINSLLASPGFATWMTGEPLNINKMLYGEKSKPQIAIYSLAHLNDSERMFFVSLLLNQTVGWMRAQSGTTSLRALVYMDEIFGYLPPTQNPPSKKPLMLLLKQARAFGVGMLLATQNPVDLDYKALSNIGTWFLGRLQTERDKARVLDGLEGAASSQNSKFDRGDLDLLLAGLGNRIFLMNNTHEDGPVVFQVRWCMTYLRGPLTRLQIKLLMDGQRKEYAQPPGAKAKKRQGASAGAAKSPTEPTADEQAEPASPEASAVGRPSVPSSVDQFFFPPQKPAGSEGLVYLPTVMSAAEISFNDASKDIFVKKKVVLINKLTEDLITIAPDKGTRIELDVNALSREPAGGTTAWEPLPDFARQSKTYTAARDAFIAWAAENEVLETFHSPIVNAYSQPDESEDEFRSRLGHRLREIRDAKMDGIRQKYGAKARSLQDDLARAEAAVEKQQAEARAAKVSTAVSIGQTILGVLLGRKTTSSTITGGARSARGAGKAWKESGDLKSAEARLADVQQVIDDLNAEAEEEVAEIKRQCDPAALELTRDTIRPLKKNIVIQAYGLAWLPYVKTSSGMDQAWQKV